MGPFGPHGSPSLPPVPQKEVFRFLLTSFAVGTLLIVLDAFMRGEVHDLTQEHSPAGVQTGNASGEKADFLTGKDAPHAEEYLGLTMWIMSEASNIFHFGGCLKTLYL